MFVSAATRLLNLATNVISHKHLPGLWKHLHFQMLVEVILQKQGDWVKNSRFWFLLKIWEGLATLGSTGPPPTAAAAALWESSRASVRPRWPTALLAYLSAPHLGLAGQGQYHTISVRALSALTLAKLQNLTESISPSVKWEG